MSETSMLNALFCEIRKRVDIRHDEQLFRVRKSDRVGTPPNDYVEITACGCDKRERFACKDMGSRYVIGTVEHITEIKVCLIPGWSFRVVDGEIHFAGVEVLRRYESERNMPPGFLPVVEGKRGSNG